MGWKIWFLYPSSWELRSKREWRVYIYSVSTQVKWWINKSFRGVRRVVLRQWERVWCPKCRVRELTRVTEVEIRRDSTRGVTSVFVERLYLETSSMRWWIRRITKGLWVFYFKGSVILGTKEEIEVVKVTGESKRLRTVWLGRCKEGYGHQIELRLVKLVWHERRTLQEDERVWCKRIRWCRVESLRSNLKVIELEESLKGSEPIHEGRNWEVT